MSFLQDIRELLMAFFPGEPVSTGPAAAEDDDICTVRACREYPDRLTLYIYSKAADKHKSEHECEYHDETALTGDKASDRAGLKKCLYNMLSHLTGSTLPWGTLTGVRPVHIADRLLTNGLTEDETISEVTDRYLVSTEKARLMVSVAGLENRLLEPYGSGAGYSLYIGIPFCPSTCLYCSFTSNPYPDWENRAEDYLLCISKELDSLKYITGEELPCTIYIGGGTPTSLSAGMLNRLFEILSRNFEPAGGLGKVREITVEAGRPDSIDREKLKVLKCYGTGRICINPQTMNDRTLRLIGRRHTEEQTVRAYEAAREEGFDNINMDIITGLPGENIDDVGYTLEKISKLKPDSLTVHTLCVKRSSALNIKGLAWGAVNRAGVNDDTGSAEAMTRLCRDCAVSMGMRPYYLYRQKNMAGNQENTGYSLPGRECIYNILMMEEKQTVIGTGAGSATKLVIKNADPSLHQGNRYRVESFRNVKNVRDYMTRTDEIIEKRHSFVMKALKGGIRGV